MKRFFSGPDGSVSILASANVAAEGANKVVSHLASQVDVWQAILHLIVQIGQAAVAAVTVYYIWRKAKAVPFPPRKRKKDTEDEDLD